MKLYKYRNNPNNPNYPVIKINRKLDKLARKVLFPKQLEEANRILKTVGLPPNLK